MQWTGVWPCGLFIRRFCSFLFVHGDIIVNALEFGGTVWIFPRHYAFFSLFYCRLSWEAMTSCPKRGHCIDVTQVHVSRFRFCGLLSSFRLFLLCKVTVSTNTLPAMWTCGTWSPYWKCNGGRQGRGLFIVTSTFLLRKFLGRRRMPDIDFFNITFNRSLAFWHIDNLPKPRSSMRAKISWNCAITSER